MSEGSSKLVRQLGRRGFYAQVLVKVEFILSGRDAVVTFDDEYAKEFRAAAQFGAEYAWEQYQRIRGEGRGLHVHVIEIGWQPVDTASVLVAYVATEAVWQALGWNPLGGPRLDEESGSISFPKFVA